jgi:hypothetical protein
MLLAPTLGSLKFIQAPAEEWVDGIAIAAEEFGEGLARSLLEVEHQLLVTGGCRIMRLRAPPVRLPRHSTRLLH